MSAVRQGGCHCGAVRFEVELPESIAASRCNCSICAIKGAAMTYVPLKALRLTAGEDVVACYRFNTMQAEHHFCPRCGIHLFHKARSDPDKYGVNLAALDGVRVYEDFAEVPVFDGQRHSSDNDDRRYQAGWLRFEPTPDEDWPDGVI